ncbi:MAG TPA: hypothetical protein VFP17_03135 [Solirubrobacterales bacterium]|nr:hypothetical protein [Solirubrobacterales bacterium]
MKEHVLSDSDRAALQSLIPLAGALGAGTIFALFFGEGRRRTGVAVFEVFAIVSVLVAVGTTAYLSISLMHANEPLSDRELAQTAAPLIVAVFVLVLVSVARRLPSSLERAFAILPLILVAGAVSALLAASAWEAEPAGASVFALALLGVGAVLALLASAADRLSLSWDRGISQKWLTRIVRAGYVPERRPVALAMPEAEGEEARPLACWNRRGSLFVDAPTLRRLRDLADRRWSELESAEALPPARREVLFGVRVGPWLPFLRPHRRATLNLLDRGEPRSYRLEENEDRLFDVTAASLLGPPVVPAPRTPRA